MSKPGRYLSLRLVAVLMLITTLVMTAFLVLRSYRSYQEIEGKLHTQAGIVASRVANAVRPTIWNIYQKGTSRQFSEDVASAILDSELESPEVSSIRVYGNFGHLFMGRIRDAQGKIVTYTAAYHTQVISAAALVVRKPIMQEGITIGNVEVALNDSRYRQFFQAGLVLDLMQLLVVGGLIVFIAYAVVRQSLVRPLREIQIAKSTLDTIDEGVIVVDNDGYLIDANPKFLALTGLRKELIIDQPFDLASIIASAESSPKEIMTVLNEVNGWSGEINACRADGSVFPVWLNGCVIRDESLSISATVFLLRDTTELHEKQKAVEHLAFHDPLTGLPNRASFERQLKHDIAIAERLERGVAVLFIDLDDFKSVNDSLGHEMGDRLLVKVAERFQSRLRDSDTLARIGGDEFTVILTNFEGRQDYAAIGEELVALAAKPVKLDERELYIGASIGVAVFPDDGVTSGELLKHADTAMYRAKDRGRNRISFYSAEQDEYSDARIALESGLRRALKFGEFELLYQPKVKLLTNAYEGVEALLRWRKEDGGYVPPLDFIPFAEERGLIIPIGRWIVQEAVRQLAEWQQLINKDVCIAINLSPVQFYDTEIASFLQQEVEKHQISPQSLEIEITESTLIHDMEDSIRVLTDLKRIGFRVSIDDFGTGYSSLNYLKKLPIDCLKIDRTFIVDVDNSRKDQAITSAIVTLASNLDLSVVVEGVERQAQVDCLKSLGITLAQGYFFSKALPADQIVRMMQDGPGKLSS
ncbi:MAG: EAL domain-containing protein [Hahellaceae bacterium]|nr:EAL domain-containing protein [Hahellaceae bacterium]MCP5209759.1 EAL domain-containing protein [Hahellaceae bacterium]